MSIYGIMGAVGLAVAGATAPIRGGTRGLKAQGRTYLVRAVALLDSVLVNLCAFVLGMMVLIALAGIFFRYVLMNALSWTEELTRYMMILVGMFGTALALWKDEHVGFTTVVDRLPPRWQKVAHVVSYLLVGALSVVMVVEGFRWVSSSGAKAQILPIPMWIPLSLVPLGGIVIAIVVFAKIVLELGGPEQ